MNFDVSKNLQIIIINKDITFFSNIYCVYRISHKKSELKFVHNPSSLNVQIVLLASVPFFIISISFGTIIFFRGL